MRKVALALWGLFVLPFSMLLGLYMGKFPWPFLISDTPVELISSILLSVAIWGVPALLLFEMIKGAGRGSGGRAD